MENKRKLWIIGANSDIAKELILYLARLNYDLILTARNIDALDAFINAENLSAKNYSLEITSEKSLRTFYEQQLSGSLDGIIYCAGNLPDETEPVCAEIVNDTFMSNVVAFISLMELAKGDFKMQRKGFVLAISSIAGERGKASNKIYGATKAALTIYLQGLMQELRPFHVKVFIVKPGIVRTRMTQHLQNAKSIFFMQSSQNVARKIVRNIQKKNSRSFTVGGLWYLVSVCIRFLPENVYQYLTL